MWRNILHPHQKTVNMSSMTSKLMCYRLSLPTSMRKDYHMKGLWKRFNICNEVTKRGERLLIASKSIDYHFEYPSKTIERKPRPWANFKALSATSASKSATKNGREFFFIFIFPKLKLEPVLCNLGLLLQCPPPQIL